MSNKKLMREKVLQSNKYVHSFLAERNEYTKSPHFLPENQKKVRDLIEDLSKKLNKRSKMIDFGCGTGFIIHLAHDLFDEVVGIDITPEMMELVDLSSGNITLIESLAEETPFKDNTFDFATAYSFMDHLFDYKSFLQEVYRVLKPGGIFYADLNPNRDFIVAMEQISYKYPDSSYTAEISKEVTGALKNGEHYQAEFGIDPIELNDAEPGKSVEKGFFIEDVRQVAKDIGFSKSNIELEWFVNQGEWLKERSHGQMEAIEQYLRSMTPLSNQFYKYLRFIFVK